MLHSVSSQIIISPDTTICGSYQDVLVAVSSNPSFMATDDQHDICSYRIYV